jgi:hypothetical protein
MVGSDRMGWGGMEWDGMGWDGKGQDGIGWGEVGRDGLGWVGLGWVGMGRDGMDWHTHGMGWDGMGRKGTGWGGMGWDGVGVGSHPIGSDRITWARIWPIPSDRQAARRTSWTSPPEVGREMKCESCQEPPSSPKAIVDCSSRGRQGNEMRIVSGALCEWDTM